MNCADLNSAFSQIAPRGYVTVAQYFRKPVDQNPGAIKEHLRQATKNLISVQPCLAGELFEDEQGFIHFRSRPLPELHEIDVKEIDQRRISFEQLERSHYGPSHCQRPEFAMAPIGNDRVFHTGLCWYLDGFAVVTFLHHTIADGLSCQYLIEALAASTCGQNDSFKHRQLRLGPMDWAPQPATGTTILSKEDQALFEQHCAYVLDGVESGPLASKGVKVVPPGLKTQFLLRAWTPGGPPKDEKHSTSRFCRRAAQAWILTMVARHRAGRLSGPHSSHKSDPAEQGGAPPPPAHPQAHFLFAVGLRRPDDELCTRAIYFRTSYPVSRLLEALDSPAEARALEAHISKAVRAAHLPALAAAHELAFGEYLRSWIGLGPAGIQLCAAESDPFAFFFNTWRFMGLRSSSRMRDRGTSSSSTPISWQFPGFSGPVAPECIRKVSAVYGAASYCLVQPSAKTGRDDDEDSPDEIVLTLEGGEAPEFTALVEALDLQRHAGISSLWQVLDVITEIA